MRRKSNLDLATVEDRQVSFVSNNSEGNEENAGANNVDGNEDEKSDSEILNE
jgi:hypothetical protein